MKNIYTYSVDHLIFELLRCEYPRALALRPQGITCMYCAFSFTHVVPLSPTYMQTAHSNNNTHHRWEYAREKTVTHSQAASGRVHIVNKEEEEEAEE